MSRTKRILTLAVIGAMGALAYAGGTSLVKDVQFARAEAQVNLAREQLQTLSDLSSAFKQVNKAMEQSVVNIQVKKNVSARARLPQFDDELFRKFFDRDGDGQPDIPEDGFQEQATGSGVIMEVVDGEAFIVTNNHVVGDAAGITVTLQDGRQITEAKVVGADPKSDLAVVKIKADRVIAARWGDSDKLEKGDIIVAFGSPFGYVGSMSHGIVSALNRQAGVISSSFAYENFIQVDAPINPGNSGGPLVNLSGEVVGINTAIASRSGSFSGVGFAIPANQAKPTYEALKTHGKIVRGYLGVQIADVNSTAPEIRDVVESLGYAGDKGVYVREVLNKSPAYKLIKPGDIITEIDGKSVTNMVELRNRIAMTTPGQEVKLTVWRDKKTETVVVKLAEQPDDQSLMASREAAPGAGGAGLSVVTPGADDLEAAGLPSDVKGALVKGVRPNSPAARANIRPGDLITRIDDAEITSADDASEALRDLDLQKGARVHLLNRQGEKMVMIRQVK